jgi:hypothetical protein
VEIRCASVGCGKSLAIKENRIRFCRKPSRELKTLSRKRLY